VKFRRIGKAPVTGTVLTALGEDNVAGEVLWSGIETTLRLLKLRAFGAARERIEGGGGSLTPHVTEPLISFIKS
jgi:hypothetical protein